MKIKLYITVLCIFSINYMIAQGKKVINTEVYIEHKIKDGEIIQFQTLEDFYYNNMLIPKTTKFFAKLEVNKYRGILSIKSFSLDDLVIFCDFDIYDKDGIKGIYLSNNNKKYTPPKPADFVFKFPKKYQVFLLDNNNGIYLNKDEMKLTDQEIRDLHERFQKKEIKTHNSKNSI